MQSTAPEELLSIGEAALLIGVHRDTLRRWEKAGRITSARLPNTRGDRRYRRSEVEALLQSVPGTATIATPQ